MNAPDMHGADTGPVSAGEISPFTRVCTLPELTLEDGQRLEDVPVAYRTWGRLNASGDNAIVVCHALTGSADADAWWRGLFGEHGVLHPSRHYIVCSNVLAGCYGTLGPLHPHPDDGQPWGSRFPRVTVRDMVHLQARLLERLGVNRIKLVLGPSLGGMQALEWAASYPDRVEAIAPIGACGRRSAWGIALSEAQRQAIYADPHWQEGRYRLEQPPRRGLATARMVAMISYRSWANFEERFGRSRQPDARELFAVESYLRYQGDKLHQRFDANSYVRLTQAMDSHDLARGRGEYPQVLERLDLPALVVSVDSDVLYPPHEQRELARHMPQARHRVLHSSMGHDGFLIEVTALNRLLGEFLEELDRPASCQGAR